MTYCANCGTQLQTEGAFCPSCGKPTNQATVAESTITVPVMIGLGKKIWQWIIILFLGLMTLVGATALLLDFVTIARGGAIVQSGQAGKFSSQGLFWWVVGFTYFFNKYYWKRDNKTRPNGIVTGALSAIFIASLVYGVAILFR